LNATGQQPMFDPALGLAVAFNGCIYNFRELRGTLEAKGYRFFSTCDTEVILKAWHAWGARCVERFYGMVAFAVRERDSSRVGLARDRLGIKPLYLAETKGGLRFASTLPALLAAGDVDTAIDKQALHHYMSFHAVVPAPLTLLRGVRKLPPATVLTIEPDGTRHQQTYWTLTVGAEAKDRAMTAPHWPETGLHSPKTAVAPPTIPHVPARAGEAAAVLRAARSGGCSGAGSTASSWSRCWRTAMRPISRPSRSASTASATSRATSFAIRT